MTVASAIAAVPVLATFSAVHWVIIALAILILFGGKKLPELARGLGRGLRIFKEEVSGVKSSINDSLEDEPKPSKPADTKPVDVKPADPKDASSKHN